MSVLRHLAYACLVSLSAMPAEARVIVLGDSIGVGLSLASGASRLAENSVAIQSAKSLEQLTRTPPGTVAVVSLGTNDAVGNLKGVDKAIDRFLDAAARQQVQLIWAGPPCVFKKWNTNVATLDQMLARKLAGRATYVSNADAAICDRSIRGGDGVHFNMNGYKVLWDRVVLASQGQIPGQIPSAPQKAVPAPLVAAAPQPAPGQATLQAMGQINGTAAALPQKNPKKTAPGAILPLENGGGPLLLTPTISASAGPAKPGAIIINGVPVDEGTIHNMDFDPPTQAVAPRKLPKPRPIALQ